jgi:hypothetical protein
MLFVAGDLEGYCIHRGTKQIEQLSQGGFVSFCNPAGELTFQRGSVRRGRLAPRGRLIGNGGSRAHVRKVG